MPAMFPAAPPSTLPSPARAGAFAPLSGEALGEAAIETTPPRLARTLEGLDGLTPGDFANVVRQRTLLGESLSPEDFLRRLMQECRWKAAGGLHPAAA